VATNRCSSPIGGFSQCEANGAGSLLATTTFLGQPADIIGPEAATLVAPPDDGTPMFNPPRSAGSALLLATVPCRGTARSGLSHSFRAAHFRKANGPIPRPMDSLRSTADTCRSTGLKSQAGNSGIARPMGASDVTDGGRISN
jgi:hypothetical protein